MNTKESLSVINERYISECGEITDNDVAKANDWAALIERSRDSRCPVIGDVVRYTNDHGTYCAYAHVKQVSQQGIMLCGKAATPFVGVNDEGLFTCICDGGPVEKAAGGALSFVGTEQKPFRDWGSYGVCAGGAFYFDAQVNVWEYSTPNPKYGGYSTRDWCRLYFTKYANQLGQSHYCAYENSLIQMTEGEFLAWLTTYKAVEFSGNSANQTVVFAYRQCEHLVSMAEWSDLNLPIDTRPIGLGAQFIKFAYDDATHTIHEYRYTNASEPICKANRPYRVALSRIKSGEVWRDIRPCYPSHKVN